FADRKSSPFDLFADLQNLLGDQRRTGEGFAHAIMPALVSLRELDFAFARKQRDGPHFAQIHANRIVRLIAEILGEFKVGKIVGVIRFAELWLLENLDASAIEIGKQVVKLTAGRELISEQIAHLVIEDEPLLLAGIEQLFYAAEFFVCCHRRPNNQRVAACSRSGPFHSVYTTDRRSLTSSGGDLIRPSAARPVPYRHLAPPRKSHGGERRAVVPAPALPRPANTASPDSTRSRPYILHRQKQSPTIELCLNPQAAPRYRHSAERRPNHPLHQAFRGYRALQNFEEPQAGASAAALRLWLPGSREAR